MFFDQAEKQLKILQEENVKQYIQKYSLAVSVIIRLKTQYRLFHSSIFSREILRQYLLCFDWDINGGDFKKVSNHRKVLKTLLIRL